MHTLEELWPVFGLKVTAGPLELSPITDSDLPGLIELIRSGLHDPATMPFAHPWTEGEPEDVAQNSLKHFWRARFEMSPEAWKIHFAVRHKGVLVGIQEFSTSNYRVTKAGGTGSWLALKHQGRGIGTLMRQTVCALFIDCFDAEEIVSGAFLDNPASLAVSRKVGYRANGLERKKRREGELALQQNLVLAPRDLVRPVFPLEVEGVSAARAFLGLER